MKIRVGDVKRIEMMNQERAIRGIEGQKAPELEVDQWVDGHGNVSSNYRLQEHTGKYRVLYCFQSWCPGCHSVGLPALQKMVDELGANDKVQFAVIQTVFEGSHANTYEKMLEVQKQYDLKIPFGHDLGNEQSGGRSTTMNNYSTGGTPWFIIIDNTGKVVFNDFHLDTEKVIAYISEQAKKL